MGKLQGTTKVTMETKEVLTLPTIMVDMVIMTAITTIITDTDGEDMTRVIMVDMGVMEVRFRQNHNKFTVCCLFYY